MTFYMTKHFIGTWTQVGLSGHMAQTRNRARTLFAGLFSVNEQDRENQVCNARVANSIVVVFADRRQSAVQL